MTLDVLLVHSALALTLFLLINWIGRHSYSIGYMEISMFVRTEEAPAFNFVFRILGPVVFLFISSALLYALALDRYVHRIYLVSAYYILIRLAFNLATNRALLLNWVRQGLYWAGILSLSYLAYEKVISVRANIFPDFSTFANELWIIVLIFLFQTMNQLRFSAERTTRRKAGYLRRRMQHFSSLYGSTIEHRVPNAKLRSLIYSIIIYEDFNRPRVIRWVENLVFRLRRKPMSLGVMQVKASTMISDEQSVDLGVKKVLDAWKKSIERIASEISNPPPGGGYYSANSLEYFIERDILKDYNPDNTYISEVSDLSHVIQRELVNCKGHSLAPQSLIDAAVRQLPAEGAIN